MNALKTGVFAVAGVAAGVLLQKGRIQKELARSEVVGHKYYSYYQLLNQWLSNQAEGKRISDFFAEEGIATIAVYGLGPFADRLMDALSGSGIEICYGVDQDASCTNSRVGTVYSPCDDLPEVDAVVITPFCASREIERMLKQRCQYRLLSLDQIIYSL